MNFWKQGKYDFRPMISYEKVKKSKGGIIIPDTAKEKKASKSSCFGHQKAEVVRTALLKGVKFNGKWLVRSYYR